MQEHDSTGWHYPAHPDTPLGRLTLREREITDYLTHGRSNKYIAVELGVTQRTIEAHRARIFQKLRVRNAVELTRYCLMQHRNDTDPDSGASGPAAPVGIRPRRRPWPASRPARRSGRCLPGGSAGIPAAGFGRSAVSGAAHSTG